MNGPLTAHLPTEENWDGDGAHPTSGQARRVLEALSVVPTVEGGAQIELHAGGVDLEIEIESTGKVTSIAWGARRG